MGANACTLELGCGHRPAEMTKRMRWWQPWWARCGTVIKEIGERVAIYVLVLYKK